MVVRSRTSRIAHVLERVGLAMMGASGGLFVAVLLAKVGIEVLTFPVGTFAIMIYGAIGFYLGIDLPRKHPTHLRPTVLSTSLCHV